MFIFKRKYFLYIENTKDIELENIKNRNKFIIIYRNQRNIEKIDELKNFRKKCKCKNIAFLVANNLNLAILLKADGFYLSAYNKSFNAAYRKKNYLLVGSAHNIKDINLKEKQGCEYILFSRLFKVSYKPKMNYLGINRYNSYVINLKIATEIIPLGGININNLNKLKIVRSNGIALLSEIKKKPAKIISRLF